VGDLVALLRQRAEQLARDALLGQALDELGPLQGHRDLVRDRGQQLVSVLVPRLLGAGHERPEQLGAGGDGDGERGGRRAVQAQRPADDAAQPQRLRRRALQHLQQHVGGAVERRLVAVLGRVGGDDDEPPARIELEQPAAVAGQELADARGGDPVELGAVLDRRDPAAQGRELREIGDALLGLLVELGVLDRPGDDRRGLPQHVEDALVELVRRRRVHDDHADHVAAARRHRDRRHRLEAVLLELGDEVRPRVIRRALADERGLAVAHRPAREALVDAELDPPDLPRVHRRGGAQPQPAACDEVDEAGVRVGDAGEQVDDPAQDVVEVGRRRDEIDDRGQRLVLEAHPLQRAGRLPVSGARRHRSP
jgi:hypothetical protein